MELMRKVERKEVAWLVCSPAPTGGVMCWQQVVFGSVFNKLDNRGLFEPGNALQSS